MLWQRALTSSRPRKAFSAESMRLVISFESSGKSPSAVKSKSIVLRGFPWTNRNAFPPLKARRGISPDEEAIAVRTTNWTKRRLASSKVVLF